MYAFHLSTEALQTITIRTPQTHTFGADSVTSLLEMTLWDALLCIVTPERRPAARRSS